MVIVINSVIGGVGQVDLVWLDSSAVWLQVSNYSQLSDYTVRLHCSITAVQNDLWKIKQLMYQ